MMGVLMLAVAVVGSTVIWPVNRHVMRRGGRGEVFGFWLGLGGSVVPAFLNTDKRTIDE